MAALRRQLQWCALSGNKPWWRSIGPCSLQRPAGGARCSNGTHGGEPQQSRVDASEEALWGRGGGSGWPGQGSILTSMRGGLPVGWKERAVGNRAKLNHSEVCRPLARCSFGQAMEYAEAVEQECGGASEAEIDADGRGWRAKIEGRLADGGWVITQGDTAESQVGERVRIAANHDRPLTSGRRTRTLSAPPPSVDTPPNCAPQNRGAGLQIERIFDWQPMADIGFRGTRPHGLGVHDYLAMKHKVVYFWVPDERWVPVSMESMEKERIRVFKLTGRFLLGHWSQGEGESSWQLDRRRREEEKGGAEVIARGATRGRVEGRGSTEAHSRGREREVESRAAWAQGAETADGRAQQDRLGSGNRSGLVHAGKRADVRSSGDDRRERALEDGTKRAEAVSGKKRGRASPWLPPPIGRSPTHSVKPQSEGPSLEGVHVSGRQESCQSPETEQKWERLGSVGFRSVQRYGLSVRDYLATKSEVQWFKDDQPIRYVLDVVREYQRVFRLTGRPIFGNWRVEQRRRQRQDRREAKLKQMGRTEGAEAAHGEGATGAKAGCNEAGARHTLSAERAEVDSRGGVREAGITGAVSEEEERRVIGRVGEKRAAMGDSETGLVESGHRAKTGFGMESFRGEEREAALGAVAGGAISDLAEVEDGGGGRGSVATDGVGDDLGHSGQTAKTDTEQEEEEARLPGAVSTGGAEKGGRVQQEVLATRLPENEPAHSGQLAEAGSEGPGRPPGSADGPVEIPASDALVQAGAEALLDALRSLPAGADARAELAARVEQGLFEWAHLDQACRTLAKGFHGDPLDQALLLAGLRVACAMETEHGGVAQKWALAAKVIRYLARGGHVEVARAVPACWPPEQSASPLGSPRMRTERVLMSELVKAGAFNEAVATFKASLGTGPPPGEVKAAGTKLARKLIRAGQFELAMGVILLVGETGEYGSYVTLVRALAEERKFLEALYLLDVYFKAVATPDEAVLDALVAQYTEHGYEQTGLEFLAVLRNGGDTPHPRIFTLLARAYRDAGLPAFVDKVNCAQLEAWGMLLEQCRAHLEAGDFSKAGEAFAQLEQMLPRVGISGLPEVTGPGVDVALERLLLAQAQAGNTGEAWQVLRWLDARGGKYAVDTLTPLFEAELSKGEGDVTPLMAAFEKHRCIVAGQVARERRPTRLHKRLFEFLVGQGSLEAAVTVFAASLDDGVSVRLSNVIRLVDKLTDARQPGIALGVLRKCPEMERDYPGLFQVLREKATGKQQGPPSE